MPQHVHAAFDVLTNYHSTAFPLGRRKTEGHITGDIRINGFPKDERTFARIMGCELHRHSWGSCFALGPACLLLACTFLPGWGGEDARHRMCFDLLSLCHLPIGRRGADGHPHCTGGCLTALIGVVLNCQAQLQPCGWPQIVTCYSANLLSCCLANVRVPHYIDPLALSAPSPAQTTVAEALAFSAHLRLPTTVDAATRHAFVEEVRRQGWWKVRCMAPAVLASSARAARHVGAARRPAQPKLSNRTATYRTAPLCLTYHPLKQIAPPGLRPPCPTP